jgi:hypothetical protein
MQYKKHTSAFRPLALSEVVAITGLPKSQIQNWTSGRPLWVIPSFGAAKGKGTRHLFALEDAYLLCYLEVLKAQENFRPSELARVLNFFNLRMQGQSLRVFHYFRPSVCWLVYNKTNFVDLMDDIESTGEQPNPRVLPPLNVNDFHDLSGRQVAVNLVKLRHAVNQRAKKLFGAEWTIAEEEI